MRKLLYLTIISLIGFSNTGTADPRGQPRQIDSTIDALSPGNISGVHFFARASPPRPEERVNILDYGPSANDGVSDASRALSKAVDVVNERAKVQHHVCIYFPPGNYLVSSAPSSFKGPGCITADAPSTARIRLTAEFSGDLFSWSEAWLAGSLPFNGDSIADKMNAGPVIRNLSIYGNRSAKSQQNALMFYDRTDLALIENVDIMQLPGRALMVGTKKRATEAYMRESNIRGLRIYNSGAPQIPAMELGSDSHSGEATNEIKMSQVDIYGSYGPSLVIRASRGTTRLINISGLRIEGKERNPAGVAADLMTIGDPVMTGQVAYVHIDGLELIDPYGGYAALRLTAPNSSTAPYAINVTGTVSGGAMQPNARGLVIDAGRSSRFYFSSIATTGPNITVGPSAGADLYLDGIGVRRWTYDLAPKVGYRPHFPALGRHGGPNGAISADIPDNGTNGGNERGLYAFDAQSGDKCRSNANQIASGYASVVLGCLNRASGRSSIAYGADNIAAGNASAAHGSFASDRSRYGIDCFAAGRFANIGDAQSCLALLRGSGSSTAPIRLTADGSTPSPTNCMNIPNHTVYGLSILVVVRNVTKPSQIYTWSLPASSLWRGESPSSTTFSMGSPIVVATSEFVPTVSAAADTKNGCLEINIIPPNDNKDFLQAVARIQSVEVQ